MKPGSISGQSFPKKDQLAPISETRRVDLKRVQIKDADPTKTVAAVTPATTVGFSIAFEAVTVLKPYELCNGAE